MFISSDPISLGEIVSYSAFAIFCGVILIPTSYFLYECFKGRVKLSFLDRDAPGFAFLCIILCLVVILGLSVNIYTGLKINNRIMTYYNIPSDVYYSLDNMKVYELKKAMDDNLIYNIRK